MRPTTTSEHLPDPPPGEPPDALGAVPLPAVPASPFEDCLRASRPPRA